MLSDEQRRRWNEDGMLVLRNFIPREECDLVTQTVDGLLSGKIDRELYPAVTVDVLAGPYIGQRLRIVDLPPDLGDVPVKVNDLLFFVDSFRDVAISKRLSDILAELMGQPVVACNSLSFVRGSQQPMHNDAWYMTPATERGLLATSICLEDHHPDAGQLFYYPGSHKIDPFVFSNGRISAVQSEMEQANAYLNDELRRRALPREIFEGRNGDMIIWSAYLLHGGSPIQDTSRTRKTLVTHYFLEQDVPAERLGRLGDGRYYLSRDAEDNSTAAIFSRFKAALYLEANPDVAAAGVDPWQHYLDYGRHEGRQLSP